MLTVESVGADGLSVLMRNNGAAPERFSFSDIFQIEDVHALNPIALWHTPHLQHFMVLGDVTIGPGECADAPVHPALRTTGQYRTVCALPRAGAQILV